MLSLFLLFSIFTLSECHIIFSNDYCNFNSVDRCLDTYFCSWCNISKTINNLEDKDPKFVVIDEYVGQSIALIFCGQSLLEYFIAFLGFRVLDIFKPYPISYFDNQKNTYGVLMDDIFAGTIVALLYLIYYEI